MKLLLKIIILSLCVSTSLYSQSVSERLEYLYLEVTLKKHNVAEASKTLEEVNKILEQEELTSDQRMQAMLIVANLHKFYGNPIKAIDVADRAISLASKEKNYLWQARFLGFTSSEYRESNMVELGKERLSQAIEVANRATKSDELFRFNKNAYYEKAFYSSLENNFEQAVSDMHKSVAWSQKIQNESQQEFSTASSYQYIGYLFNQLNQPDSALYYLEVASDKITNSKQQNAKKLLNYIHGTMGDSYMMLGELENAKKYFYLVLSSPEEYRSIGLNEQLYKSLVNYYLATGNLDSLQVYKVKADSVSQFVSNVNSQAVNAVTRALNKKPEHRNHTFLYFLSALVFLACMFNIGLLWRQNARRKQKAKKHEALALVVTDNKKSLVAVKTDTLKISEDTQKRLLTHIQQFEENEEFLNPKISATLMANQFGTNTKYLTQMLRQEYDKDFSAYINELRINYIVGLLEDEPKYRQYKISYLAELVGYSSHSKFAAVFKKVKKCSPSEFISNLEK